MYKKQLKAQKILCLLAVVVAVILFLYALGIMTDLYDTLYTTLRIRVEEGGTFSVSERSVSGAKVYYDMQWFNQWLVKFAIIYILSACLLFVTNTNIRRRYYIANYVSIGLFAGLSVYIPFASHGIIEYYKAQWLNVDFAALAEYAKTYNSAYTESTLWFDLHYGVFALMIVAAILLVANCVWKISLMKGEAKLVAAGKEAQA